MLHSIQQLRQVWVVGTKHHVANRGGLRHRLRVDLIQKFRAGHVTSWLNGTGPSWNSTDAGQHSIFHHVENRVCTPSHEERLRKSYSEAAVLSHMQSQTRKRDVAEADDLALNCRFVGNPLVPSDGQKRKRVLACSGNPAGPQLAAVENLNQQTVASVVATASPPQEMREFIRRVACVLHLS